MKNLENLLKEREMDDVEEKRKSGQSKRIAERIKIAIEKHLAVKPLWKKRKFRIFLIICLIIAISLTGLGVRKAIKEPSVKNFPETTYQEIINQLTRGKIKYFSLKYADGNAAMAGNVKTIQARILIYAEDKKIFTTEELSFTVLSFMQLTKQIEDGQIKNIIHAPSAGFYAVSIPVAVGQFNDKGFLITYPSSIDLSSEEIQKIFRKHGVEFWEVEFRIFSGSNWGTKWGWLTVALILWLVLPLLLFVSNYLQGTGMVREKSEDFERPAVKFEDVAGIDEAKEEILKVIDVIKNPEPYIALGAELPAGILLEGAPGVGKTLLARAIANECGFPFVTSEQAGFMEIYVGTGPKKVRELFDKARRIAQEQKTRVIIFIDEIDSIGKRSAGGEGGGGADEQNRTIAQLNQEIDGLHSDRSIIILGATNQPENIDPALLRPGRLSKRIVVPTPSLKGRVEILKVHTKNKPLSPLVDLEKVARLTPTGTTGADLMNIANVAAIEAGRLRKKIIDMEDFERAINKVMVGEERKGIILTEKEKWTFASHEAGHALMAIVLRKLGFDIPLPKKISIVPTTKGMGGYTQFIESEERLLLGKKECVGLIEVLFGGRVAEENLVGEISSGAKNDYERASSLAEQMATVLAMEDDRLGHRVFTIEMGSGYLGQVTRMKTLSPEKLAEIDKVIDKRLKDCYQKAKRVLEIHKKELRFLAETIKANEILEITPEIIDGVKIQDGLEDELKAAKG